jgi:GTP-binding protein HflX
VANNLKKGIICYLALTEKDDEIIYDLEELKELLINIGIDTAGKVIQRRRPDPNYLLGEGKIREIKEQAKKEKLTSIIFNRELSPRQVKTLEEMFEKIEIWDRTQVILEIFRRRAHSKEGKIQVELAQLTYLYPRIMGLGGVLSRLGGGIGTRGPGETKLEVMRRYIHQHIFELKKELSVIRENRTLLRKQRQKEGIPTVSLIGYTNAGKSSLLNSISVSEHKVLARDQLFATLDPVSRRIRMPSGRFALFTDTVGFIKQLPPKLKESFKSTLEELEAADLLLHVIDLTSPYLKEQVEAVENLLAELKLDYKPVLKAYNKVDIYDSHLPADGIAVSALTGANLTDLLTCIEKRLFPEFELNLLISFEQLGKISSFREKIRILKEEYLPEGVRLKMRGRLEDIQKLKAQLKNIPQTDITYTIESQP